MRRRVRRDKQNPVQLAPLPRCPRQRQMSLMHRIESPAKQSNIHAGSQYRISLQIQGSGCKPESA